MIRQKIVTQCSLIRLPGYPDNTVINYVFPPCFFPLKCYIWLSLIYMCINIYLFHLSLCLHPPPSACFSRNTPPLHFYCNKSLIERGDSAGGVLCGSTYQCYQLIFQGQLLAAVVFSLITSCQYANKLPRLPAAPRRVSRIFGGGDENIADAVRIAISRCNMMCEFQQAHSILPPPPPPGVLHSYWEGSVLMLNRKERYEQAESKPGPSE